MVEQDFDVQSLHAAASDVEHSANGGDVAWRTLVDHVDELRRIAGVLQSLRTRLEAAERKVEELEADKRRMDWLEANVIWVAAGGADRLVALSGYFDGRETRVYDKPTIRAAVDAAVQERSASRPVEQEAGEA